MSPTNDQLDRQILFVTSNDGSSTLKMMHVTTRVVCQNTLSVSLCGAQKSVSILHRANYKDRVSEAQRALKISYGYFDNLGLLIAEMSKARMSQGDMRSFAEKLLPIPAGQNAPRTERPGRKSWNCSPGDSGTPGARSGMRSTR